MQPDDFKDVSVEINHGFLVDNNGNAVARVVSEHQMTDLKTLLKEAEEGKLYWVHEGKDGKPEVVEVNNEH